MDIDELTRSDSDGSSLITENSKGVLQQKAITVPSNCAAWTNEKHDQYLNRLEESFVKQLHRSMGRFGGWSGQKNATNSSMKQPANTEQYTVLRDGCWQKINYVKTITADSHDVPRNPWVKHLKHAGRPCSTGSADLNECCKIQQEVNLLREQKMSSASVVAHAEYLPVDYTYHFGSVGTEEEGSGQNFADEGSEDDSKCQINKLKTSVADTSSSDDQTVPTGKLLLKNNSVAGDIALEEEQARHQIPSEDYRSFPYLQPALEPFLLGS